MTEPIDHITAWGEEEPAPRVKKPPDWCEYKNRRCPWWDQDCQADVCINDSQRDETF